MQSLVDSASNGSIDISEGFLKGSLSFRTPLDASFSYADETSTSGRGTLHIASDGVRIRGLRLRGTVMIDSGLSEVSFSDCVIFGNVKVGSGCSDVCLTKCAIEPERGVGLAIETNSSLRIVDSIFSRSLVGISLTNEVFLADSVGSFAPPSSPLCVIERCRFDSNQTDVVVQMLLRSGTSPGHIAVVYPSLLLSLRETKSAMEFEVSLGGRFETPLLFKEWPIPLESLDGLQVPRRGFQSNNRFCYLQVKDDSITVTEDAFVPGPERKRKRAVKTPQFSRAQIHYADILGLEVGCTKDDVQKAYKRLALQHHPDKTGGNERSFIEVKLARDQLMKILDNC